MPELPEVETMRRGILSIVGKRITAAERVPCPRKPILVAPGPAAFRKRAVGRKVTAEEMAAINITPLRFHGEWNYVIHPR